MDIDQQIGVPTTLKISFSGNQPFSRNMRSKVKRSRSTAKKRLKQHKDESKYIFKKNIFLFSRVACVSS